jgi:hypothetical protein
MDCKASVHHLLFQPAAQWQVIPRHVEASSKKASPSDLENTMAQRKSYVNKFSIAKLNQTPIPVINSEPIDLAGLLFRKERKIESLA